MPRQSSLTYRIRRWVKRVAPPSLVDLVRRPLRAVRSRIKAQGRRGAPTLTREQLGGCLRQAGIRDGDIVMVHTSLSGLGQVDGGAETVIAALIDVLSEGGTLMMPCYNSADETIRELKRGRFVDLRNHPAVTGAVTERFRTWPDVARSSHPFSSVCAWGVQAEFMTSGHADRPEVCHATSPVGRLVELNGFVVGLGISIAQGLGVAHCVEDTTSEFPFEVHTPVFEVTYIDSHGQQITREVCRFDPVVSETRIDYPKGRWILGKLTRHLVRKGLLTEFRCGSADAWIMRTRPLYDELKRLAAKGVTMYLTPERLTDKNSAIDSW